MSRSSLSAPEAPPVALPPGRFVELPGRGTTFVRELAGPPGAPTVLLLHGWTATADLTWFATYAPLAEHVRVVALDQRGHGRGIRSHRRFTLADCADDAAALLEVLGTGPVVVAGYSMGGPVALLLWQRRPDLVAGLGLFATTACFAPSRRARARMEVLGVLAAASRSVPLRWAEAAGERVLDVINQRRGLAPWVAAELGRGDGQALLEAGHQLARFDGRPWVASVDVPTSVLVTTLDQMVAPDDQRWLAATIPGATVLAVAGEHTVCVGDPDRFAPVAVAAVRSVADRLH